MNVLRGFSVLLLLGVTGAAVAHGGRLNAEGCHNDNVHGGYHCHGRKAAAPHIYAPTRTPRNNFSGGSVSYANCSEARAAGAAPVHRGDPGYASHLDRDNDGVGCE
jgi:hypothetical protein